LNSSWTSCWTSYWTSIAPSNHKGYADIKLACCSWVKIDHFLINLVHIQCYCLSLNHRYITQGSSYGVFPIQNEVWVPSSSSTQLISQLLSQPIFSNIPW
jgi:hypothetical protein